MIPGLVMENQILAVMRRIIRATDLHSRRLMETVGLTGPQLVTLEAAAHLGPVSTTTLARAVYLSPATLTGILDRLERRGLLERFRDIRDRRSWLVTVTAAGQELLESAPSPLQSRFREQLAKLADWEQSQILSSLQRIASMMEVEDAGASAQATDQPDSEDLGNPLKDVPHADTSGGIPRRASPQHAVSPLEFSSVSSVGAAGSPEARVQPPPGVSPDTETPGR